MAAEHRFIEAKIEQSLLLGNENTILCHDTFATAENTNTFSNTDKIFGPGDEDEIKFEAMPCTLT